MITTGTVFFKKGRTSEKRKANWPEVILRKGCTYYEKRGKAYPIPELLLLANQAGFRWLSELFAYCARKTGETGPPFCDPDDHEHLRPHDLQINQRHSDEFAFRLGILTRRNRRAVFEKYGLTEHKPFKGDLVSQYQRQIAEVRVQWRRLLTIDRQLKKAEEKENQRWKPVLDKLRRKQKREQNQAGRASSARPKGVRRLFRGRAVLQNGPAFQRPPARGAPTPASNESVVSRLFVFARSEREASRRFSDALRSAGYKVIELSSVYSGDRPTKEDRFIRPGDVLRAWDTGEVLYGCSF